MNSNEILNYEVLDSVSNGMNVSSVKVITELAAIIPNALAAPFHHYQEVEAKKEIALKMLEHQTKEHETLCDFMLELAKLGQLDSEKFQTIMVAYGVKHIL